jgi:hypothetical protein
MRYFCPPSQDMVNTVNADIVDVADERAFAI